MWPFGGNRGEQARLLRRAQAFMRRKQWDQARLALEALLERFPDAVQARADYGAVLYHLERYGEALEELERVVREDETIGEAWLNLAACANQLGLMNRAREALDKAAERVPRARNLHYNLAILRLKEGRTMEAMAELETELSLYPDNLPARALTAALEERIFRN
ncbi:MAG: tetratricopeptide repeat protein [Armatimonadetes bacterium]|nr:tetratricopeptide repeat protein [Armatimonadota bacterium]